MTHDPNFRFAADMQTATISIRRDFAAPRPMVWDCYSKPELLDRWFAPKPLTTKTKHMDFTEGGHWHFAMITPDGTEYWNRQDYIVISPVESFTARDCFTDETGVPNTDMPGAEMQLTFHDTETGTQVRTSVQYPNAADLEKVIAMGLEQGLASTLESLDDLLAELTA